MYYVTKRTVVSLGSGRTVLLGEGPRGKRTLKNRAGTHVVDQDASLKAALPASVFQRLVDEGTIVEHPDAV